MCPVERPVMCEKCAELDEKITLYDLLLTRMTDKVALSGIATEGAVRGPKARASSKSDGAMQSVVLRRRTKLA
jgi:hypothetical protein